GNLQARVFGCFRTVFPEYSCFAGNCRFSETVFTGRGYTEMAERPVLSGKKTGRHSHRKQYQRFGASKFSNWHWPEYKSGAFRKRKCGIVEAGYGPTLQPEKTNRNLARMPGKTVRGIAEKPAKPSSAGILAAAFRFW